MDDARESTSPDAPSRTWLDGSCSSPPLGRDAAPSASSGYAFVPTARSVTPGGDHSAAACTCSRRHSGAPTQISSQRDHALRSFACAHEALKRPRSSFRRRHSRRRSRHSLRRGSRPTRAPRGRAPADWSSHQRGRLRGSRRERALALPSRRPIPATDLAVRSQTRQGQAVSPDPIAIKQHPAAGRPFTQGRVITLTTPCDTGRGACA